MVSYKSVSGHCPKIKGERNILVEYTSILMAGQLKPGYKKTAMRCDDYHECEFLDSYNRCPIMINAPEEP